MAAPAIETLVLPDGQGSVIQRGPVSAPARHVAVVVPGSGCAGLAPIAADLFRGLLHAHLRVLHKPGVDPQAWPPPPDCDPAFIDGDHHQRTLDAASTSLAVALADLPPALPVTLIGLSEGAEFLPHLAAQLGSRPVLALVLVAHPGRDPIELGALQARRQQQSPRWQAAMDAARGALPAAAVIEGRSARYWQDLQRWALWQPLLDSGLPVLRVWGLQDELIPPAAWAETPGALAPTRWWCDLAVPAADHGLRRTDRRVESWPRVWALVEALARQWPQQPDCAAWQIEDQAPAGGDAAAVPQGPFDHDHAR